MILKYLKFLNFNNEKDMRRIAYLSEELIKEINSKNTNLERIHALISEGANVNHNNGELIHHTIRNNKLDVLEIFHQNGANLDSPYPFLEESCKQNNLSMVKYLVERNINVNGFKNDGQPSIECISNNNIEILKYLIENKAKINSIMIRESSCKGRLEIVSYLLDRVENFTDTTAVLESIYNEHFNVAKLIIMKSYKLTNEFINNIHIKDFINSHIKEYKFQKEFINQNPQRFLEIKDILIPKIKEEFRNFIKTQEWS